MTTDQVIALQTLLIGGQVLVAAFQARIYSRQAKIMKQTKDLTEAIGREQKVFQLALSRPALTVLAVWEVSQGTPPQSRFEIVISNCGNGPAHLEGIEVTLDAQPVSTRNPGDYPALAQRLFDGSFVKTCGGLISHGDFWLAAGQKEQLLQVSLNPGLLQEHFVKAAARLNVRVQYGSVFGDAPFNEAWLKPPAPTK